MKTDLWSKATMKNDSYVIRGGVAGRERMRVVARVMQPTTLALFDRVGLRHGMICLDVGCAGGDVSFELARRVGPAGRVVGMDIDAVKLELAQQEAAALQLDNIDFRLTDITDSGTEPEPRFDLVYARFLLTHLRDPAGAVARMRKFLQPGGLLLVEDIDFNGHFCYPESAAHRRYVELYQQSATQRGADANIGPRLPGMLAAAGLEAIDMNVVQPAGFEGEAKLVSAITMENIADTIYAEGLASPDEVQAIVASLYEMARDPNRVVSLPRVVQAWGRRPLS
jgi:ubiquinone/menaquinone biosynthesis C-methylase UbiE